MKKNFLQKLRLYDCQRIAEALKIEKIWTLSQKEVIEKLINSTFSYQRILKVFNNLSLIP